MRYLYILFVFVLFTQCKNTYRVKNDIGNKVDTFKEFFKDFGVNEGFQINSIEFPLLYYSVDIEDNLELTELSKAEWVFVDFSLDTLAKEREYDAYEVVLKEEGDNTIYFRKGIDNGINIEYYFKIVDQKWMLTKVVDKSN